VDFPTVKALVVILLVLPLALLLSNSPGAQSHDAPRLLIHSVINTDYLLETRGMWSSVASGFLLNYIFTDWQINPFNPYLDPATPMNGTGQKDPITIQYLHQANQALSSVGITSNAILVRTYRPVLLNNDTAWANIFNNFRDAAIFARDSGTTILAIDTEPFFHKLGSDYRNGVYSSYGDRWIQNSLFNKGRSIMQAITTEYPEIKVITFPDGDYFYTYFGTQQWANDYRFWIYFWDGMASLNNAEGIILGDEDMYRVFDGRIDLAAQILKNINDSMYAHTVYKDFWVNKGSIAPGIWPLGQNPVTSGDKSPRMSASFLDSLLGLLVSELAPLYHIQYIWIYGSGAAWYQVTNPSKYGKPLCCSAVQTAPTTLHLPDYLTVLAKYFGNIQETTSTTTTTQATTAPSSSSITYEFVNSSTIPQFFRSIPGFPIEVIITGLCLGLILTTLVCRKSKRHLLNATKH